MRMRSATAASQRQWCTYPRPTVRDAPPQGRAPATQERLVVRCGDHQRIGPPLEDRAELGGPIHPVDGAIEIERQGRGACPECDHGYVRIRGHPTDEARDRGIADRVADAGR